MDMTHIIQFFSDHFSAIMLFNAVLLSCLMAVIIVSHLRELTYGGVGFFIKTIFFYTVVVGEIILIVLCGYIYWMNYENKRIYGVTLNQKILLDTKWVKENLTVYYLLNNDLLSIQISGEGKKYLYEGKERIREYHLSPDRRNILIVTQTKLILLDQRTRRTKVIEDIDLDKKQKGITKVIDSVKWSPRGRKFCYKVAMWSSVSSQDYYYVYDMRKDEKQKFKSPTSEISDLFWDTKGQNLYYFKYQILDIGKKTSPVKVLVYKIPLSTLEPNLVMAIRSQQKNITVKRLKKEGISLFDIQEKLSFGRNEPERIAWSSPQGMVLGVDKNDDFYYQRNKWMRKRLFRVSREPILGDISYHQKVLPIKRLEWLPGGRYAIMEHSKEGLLIIEPAAGKIGYLTHGKAFGWYPF